MAIYFIQAGEAGPIKIGASWNVEARLKALSCFHYEELRLLASADGCQMVERELQIGFEPELVRGEWFSPSPRLMDFIARIKAGAAMSDLLHSIGRRPKKRCRSIHCAWCKTGSYAPKPLVY